ncbi:MAG TPA: hypothetical protein VLA36_14140, partial [Longimicrobiales bacterium]|nr:hypothetical protein [Longimicrobiales bacterium]
MVKKDKEALEPRILKALAASRQGPMKPKDLARTLNLPTEEYRTLKRLLAGMVTSGTIYRVKGNRFALPNSLDLVVGTISLTRSGDGFLRPEAGGTDVYVPSVNLATALDGDRLVTRIESRPRGRSPVGRVIKILERARTRVVGTLHRGRRFSFVVPLDRRMTRDVLVPPGDEGKAEEGDVVVVDLVSFGEGSHGPSGVVVEVLGNLSDPGVDVLAVAHSYGLALDFPAAVM